MLSLPNPLVFQVSSRVASGNAVKSSRTLADTCSGHVQMTKQRLQDRVCCSEQCNHGKGCLPKHPAMAHGTMQNRRMTTQSLLAREIQRSLCHLCPKSQKYVKRSDPSRPYFSWPASPTSRQWPQVPWDEIHRHAFHRGVEPWHSESAHAVIGSGQKTKPNSPNVGSSIHQVLGEAAPIVPGDPSDPSWQNIKSYAPVLGEADHR